MRETKKLYTVTADDYVLPSHIDNDLNVITKPANGIPMLFWPDGRWCLEANVYMIELYDRGLSRKDGGGTLKTYAANISHLIRYCFGNNINFHELTDNHFSFFIKTLSGQRRDCDPGVHSRHANHVIAIGRNCLEFLSSVGKQYHLKELVGNQILATKKTVVIMINGQRSKVTHGSRIKKEYWHHNSFPKPDALKKRLPISSKNITKLYEAAITTSVDDFFLLKRRLALLKLLEITGGRRIEIAALTVESVCEASRMQVPMLKLFTAKKPNTDEDLREIPIPHHDVLFLMEFIEINRRPLVRKLIKAGKLKSDDGYVLVSETSGKKLQSNTITQEISLLAKIAQINEQACPHMFRHRFITKLFVDIINQHKIENPDSFRQALIDIETIKKKIQEYTGHKKLSSLDVYINLAFDEITNCKQVMNNVSLRSAIDSAKATATQIGLEHRGGMSLDNASQQFLKMINAFEKDFDRFQSDTESFEKK